MLREGGRVWGHREWPGKAPKKRLFWRGMGGEETRNTRRIQGERKVLLSSVGITNGQVLVPFMVVLC